MDRKQLLSRLHESWQEFRLSLDGLMEAEMLEPGVAGDWSIKDVIVHVGVWEREALTAMPLMLEGKRARRYGTTIVVSVASAGSRTLQEKPKASTSPGETHAGLVTSVARFGDMDATVRYKTVQQLRTPTPNK